jgi:hypothetical protein
MRGGRTYRFVLRGPGVERLVDVVEPSAIHTDADLTFLTGRIEDQSHLRGVLDAISDIGLELVAFERLAPVSQSSAKHVGEL